jgi:hypothetical protein
MPNSNIDDQNDDAIITDDAADDQTGGVGGGNTPHPSPDDTEFAGMSDRERALVTKARSEEKRKLYKKSQEQERQIKELQASLRTLQQQPPAPAANSRQRETRDEKIDTLVESIQRLAEAQAQTNTRIEAMQTDEVNRRRTAELRQYAAEQIALVRNRDENLIEGLVGGDSEEEIDDSIKIANAEWKLAIQEHDAKRNRGNQTPSSVTVQGNGRGRRPAGTPPVQVANSVEAETNQESIDEITSDDAIRDGTYAKHRKPLLSRLKRSYKYTGNPI